jgi:ASC-1-like (ASCH) protein
MIHKLKITPEYYFRVKTGQKAFEIRNKSDRDFQVGDEVQLIYFDKKTSSENALFEVLYLRITYVFHGGTHGLDSDYVCFGFDKV